MQAAFAKLDEQAAEKQKLRARRFLTTSTGLADHSNHWRLTTMPVFRAVCVHVSQVLEAALALEIRKEQLRVQFAGEAGDFVLWTKVQACSCLCVSLNWSLLFVV